MSHTKHLAVQGLLLLLHVALILAIVVWIGPKLVREHHLGPDDIAAPAQFVLAGSLAAISPFAHLLAACISLVKRFPAGIVVVLGIISADVVVSGLSLWLVVVRVVETLSSGSMS